MHLNDSTPAFAKRVSKQRCCGFFYSCKTGKFAVPITAHNVIYYLNKSCIELIFFEREKKGRTMYSYELLEKECYYIVQLQPDAPLSLLQIKVATDHCLFVLHYNETVEMQWVKKSDSIHDIIECLSDEAARQWLTVYNNSEDASYYEGEEE